MILLLARPMHPAVRNPNQLLVLHYSMLSAVTYILGAEH